MAFRRCSNASRARGCSKGVTPARTHVVFRYSFETRWRALRPLLEHVIVRRFSRDLRDRLSALKRAAEDVDGTYQ